MACVAYVGGDYFLLVCLRNMVIEMTLTPEQIKEAVELADGWEWNWERAFSTAINDQSCALWGEGQLLPDQPKQWHLAALASQLISQVDADEIWYLESHQDETSIYPTEDVPQPNIRVTGPNRDENSILACCQLLRENGDG